MCEKAVFFSLFLFYFVTDAKVEKKKQKSCVPTTFGLCFILPNSHSIILLASFPVSFTAFKP